MRKQYSCLQCGSLFSSRNRQPKFCCQTCYGLWQSAHPRIDKRKRIRVACENCTTLFERVSSALGSHVFCSRACWNIWAASGVRAGEDNPCWRGGHAGYRGPNWKVQRQKALERDRHACIRCGATDSLTVNHKIPFRLFALYTTANDITNLETLCRRCHSKMDNIFWEKHPLFFKTSRFPDCTLLKTCIKCQQLFEAFPRTTICVTCCTYICDQCGSTFVSRKRRAVRFCSVACNIAFRQSQRLYPYACITCGTAIDGGRFRCWSCHLKDPTLQVRPGRKPGRKPKGQNVNDITAH